MEDKKLFKVLLVEDNKLDVDLLRAMLMDVKEAVFHFEVVSRLAEGLERLRNDQFEVALLDLTLPDSKGLDTFLRFNAYAGGIPILIVTNRDDESIALQAMREGAQDYLVKGQVTKDSFVRSIRYAIERHRLQEIIREQALRDALTGLYNRRGFYMLAEQHIRVAQRKHFGVSVIYLDMDEMKKINDQFGHSAGDEALVEMADILRETFRASDVIARIGGDEFVALALADDNATLDTLPVRLRNTLDNHNEKAGRRFLLAVSVGTLSFPANKIPSVDKLISESDQAMYDQKRRKQKIKEKNS